MSGQEIKVVELEPVMVSVPEAAKLLNIKRTRAYELVNQGAIPAVRLGERCIRVPVDGLRRWAVEAAGGNQFVKGVY